MLIYGVDFSGAKDAGKKIWISCASISQSKLAIENCLSAKDFLNSSKWCDDTYPKLRNLIERESNNIFGLDFPFGLPKLINHQLINHHTMTHRWDDFIKSFSKHFVNVEQFKNKCKEINISELKRETDNISQTPFSPYNLRLYKQTYFGITEIISPLVISDNICVVPMQKYIKGKPILLEICPASTLKKENCYKVPYKENTNEAKNNRSEILEHLEKCGINFSSSKIRKNVLDDYKGDALDSIIAAYATFKAYKNNFKTSNQELNDYFKLEGYVYA
jgi:hypothetical protein